MVLQEGALLDYLNVLDNVKLVCRQNHISKQEHELLSLLASLNIDAGVAAQSIASLSGGQMRRVAVARALLLAPDIILFDEPDAGLDLVNLSNLADVISSLVASGKACLTISHNPIYIANTATKVFRLLDGKLSLLVDWGEVARDQHAALERQTQLQALLYESTAPAAVVKQAHPPVRNWLFIGWFKSIGANLIDMASWPRNVFDSAASFARVYWLASLSGILFFAIVGLMLGATTLAVVKLLSDLSLKGIISWFIAPEDLVDMMGGRFALYLAPAVGAMLFAARSGSLVANWLGELHRSKQIAGLKHLRVPVHSFLYTPSLLAMLLGGVTTILLFAAAIWSGGLLAASHFFALPDPLNTLAINQRDLDQSQFILKCAIYSGITALTTIAHATLSKQDSRDVNAHTTATIVYSTVLVAIAELSIILL